jgi:sugar/nucleoside kinase (ribokinase family)
MATQFDCICTGVIVADFVCSPVDHNPRPGELVLTDRMDLTLGGCASNVAVDLAKLEKNIDLVGRIGNDFSGIFVKNELVNAGVNCSNLVISEQANTSSSFVINCKNEDRRFIHSVGANAELTGLEITKNLIANTKSIYVGGYCLVDSLSVENVLRIFKEAKNQDVKTFLDVVIPSDDDYWSWLEPLLPFTDYFMPNNDEGLLITKLEDPVDQARKFKDAGAGTVVITCGDKGTILIDDNLKLKASTFPVNYIDGTGSGDAFDAGYIYGVLNNQDPYTCLSIGSALGASCVQSMGATTGVFNKKQLDDFLKNHQVEIKDIS